MSVCWTARNRLARSKDDSARHELREPKAPLLCERRPATDPGPHSHMRASKLADHKVQTDLGTDEGTN